MKQVAIIGSGIAGLACASKLHQQGLLVTVFEADSHIGGHAYTHNVHGTAVDCGFMVFNRKTYPNLIEWFDQYGVELQPSDMSFAVSMPRNQGSGFLGSFLSTLATVMEGERIEWSSCGLRALIAQKSNIVNPYFLSMIKDMLAFEKDVEAFLAKYETLLTLLTENGGKMESLELEQRAILTMSLGDFLKQHSYGHYFLNYYLIPVCAAVWSCPTNDSLSFPALFILQFFKNHSLLQLVNRPQWVTVKGRSADYVKKVTKPFADRIILNAPIRSVRTTDDNRVRVMGENFQADFDDVVFACHPPDALRMLHKPDKLTTAILEQFTYQDNEVVLHRDAKFLPKNKSAWASWNFNGNCNIQLAADGTFQAQGDQHQGVAVTYWLNHLQSLKIDPSAPHADKPVLITLNPSESGLQIDPELIVTKKIMAHPVPTIHSFLASQRIPEIQGRKHMYFASASLGWGFHEDGFNAGAKAASMIICHSALSFSPTPLPVWQPADVRPPFEMNVAQSVARSVVLNFLRSFIKVGELQLHEDGGSVHVITGEVTSKEFTPIKAKLFILNANFYIRIMTRNDLGLADAYIEGEASSPDLIDFFKLCIANRDYSRMKSSGKISAMVSSTIGTSLALLQHWRRNNSISNSLNNIKSHYCLSNDMFKTFLDENMVYSCGIWRHAAESLEQAQLNKLNALLDKANIKPHHHILEIGFGWGALSILAVKRFGCKVTGITLSQEQLNYAEKLVRSLGLQDKIAFELIDYRLHKGKYDRIVSCEMLEAVGHEYLPDFYKTCDRLLKPNGLVVVQVITCPDDRYESYRTSVDFIQEYIFPGGLCPSLQALTNAAASVSKFMIDNVENIGIHYATTLDMWHQRFNANIDKVKELGFDQAFINKWRYYFMYCQAGFATSTLGVLQIVYKRAGELTK